MRYAHVVNVTNYWLIRYSNRSARSPSRHTNNWQTDQWYVHL